MSAVLDHFIVEHAPGRLVELDPALVRARAAFRAALDSLAGIADDQLRFAWMWGANQADVRYGFYRALELLEGAASAANRALAGSESSEARDAVAAATASRWQLQGVLAALRDADLDADPGDGEWSIRRTLQHIINSQRGYAWGSAYWISVRDRPRPPAPPRIPEEAFSGFPEEEDEATGALAVIRGELDDIVDATSSRYATLTAREMQVMGGWSGFPVTMGFRQWRWSSHIAEHTVQVEKTIDMLGRRRSEVDWLVRAVAVAYGRLEATVFGRESAAAAGATFDLVARELNGLYPALEAAAAAAVPAEEW